MYKSMLNKDSSFFDTTTTGDITSSIINDGSIIAESAGTNILMFWLNLLQVIIISCIMIYLHIVLGITVVIISLFYFLLVNVLNRKMRKTYKEERQEFAELNQCIIEDINAINDITVLNKKKFFIHKFKERIWHKYFSKVKNVINIQVRIYALDTIMKVILPVIIISIGVNYFFRGQTTIGTLVLFYTFVGKLIEPLNNLADFYQGKQMALGAAERIYDYLFEKTVTEQEDFVSIKQVDSLELDIHSYAYMDKTILTGIHETFIPGDRILIRGESGCGKTTLLKLICRLYELEDGEILINNESISSISEHSLYNNIQILFQQPFVFEGTILENITLGDTFDEEYIWNILHTVCIADFVKEKGLGYPLYEQGKNLSGGQKQRLCLARVLLRNPKILLLDEITSALDADTEEKLLKELEQYICRNKIIMIAVSHSHAFEKICNKHIQLS